MTLRTTGSNGTKTIEFWGLDTETDNNIEGGQAVLITLHGPSESLNLVEIKTFASIFHFLKGRTYVAFNMDFDAQALLHDTFLPHTVLKDLARFKRAFWKKFSFEYVPTKFCEVRLGKEFFRIYDLQQFFGCSLKEAAKKYLPNEERKAEIPKSWYRHMKVILSFSNSKASRVLDYARQDARLAYLLCERLLSSFRAVGVNPRKLISPASCTMEYFKTQLAGEPPVDNRTNRLWQRGFYGGRVEVTALGSLNHVSIYDIHSAYPAEIAKLPSLAQAQLVQDQYPSHIARSPVLYGLYLATVHVSLDWYYGPLAVRDGSKVIYPVGAVKTWFCKPALDWLQERKLRIDFHESHEWIFRQEPKPIFSGIESLYQARKDPVLSLAAKLMLNSLYGKLCENRRERVPGLAGNVRSYKAYGRYTNYILASHITESVRMKVLTKMMTHGGYMVATDSVMIPGEKYISTGKELGEWDLKGTYDEAVILGCGRYFLRQGSDWTGYLRGFQGTSRHLEKIRKSKTKSVKISLLQNLSMLQWANRGAVDDLNVLKDVKKELRCDDDKRFWLRRFKQIGNAFTQTIFSKPWIVGKTEQLKTLV